MPPPFGHDDDLATINAEIERVSSLTLPRLGAEALEQLIAEGLQVLEHASLVRVSWRGGMDDYTATRRGRAAVAQDEVERILESMAG